MNIKTIFYVLFIALLPACNNAASSNGGTLRPSDFEQQLRATANGLLVDVRTPGEFQKSHLPKAVNIDFQSKRFEEGIGVLDRDVPVFLYCYSGTRSEEARAKLVEMGFKKVYNLDGGIMHWQGEGKPVVEMSGASTGKSRGMSMAEFQKITDGNRYVLVDYSATWCGPCQKMAPVLASFAASKKDKLLLVPIDADNNTTLMEAKRIDGIPYLELYNRGKLVWSHSGYLDEKELAQETGL